MCLEKKDEMRQHRNSDYAFKFRVILVQTVAINNEVLLQKLIFVRNFGPQRH